MQRTKEQRLAFTERYADKQERLYKGYHRHVEDSGYKIEYYHRGQWRSHSWCNTGGCECCKNPRRVKWNPMKHQITLQERKNYESFKAQLQDYFASDND